MPIRWQKTVRDFWQERARAVSVVLAIALGVAGFAAVLSTYAILTRELNAGYLATNPASATLFTDAVDDALLAAVRSHPEIGAVEPRRAVRGRIKAGPAEWRNLVLFVVRDYGDIRIGKVQPQAGAWPPAAGEILIERDAMQVARAAIGDSVRVRTAHGTERTLRVSGTVHDVGQAQARMEQVVYGYIVLATLEQLGEEPFLDRLNIVVAEDRFNAAHVRQVATDAKTWIEALGHPVQRVDVPRPGKHPHADIMGLLLLAMASFGLFILALSGVIVVNLLMALMASQVRQIGVMKAIGGTRGQIAGIYFGQALLLGVAATIVALPLGMWGCRILCRYMAVFLNFDITSFAVPFWVYALVAAVGLVVPILAAAYPVTRGTEISVREALADFGVSPSAFGTTRFERILTRVGGTSRSLLFVLRNGFRRRTRLVLTLLTLAVGGIFFMSALNVRASMIATLDRLFATRKYDLSMSLGTIVPYEKLERAVAATPGVRRAEGWITTEGSIPGAAPAPGDSGASAPSTAAEHSGDAAGGAHGPGITIKHGNSTVTVGHGGALDLDSFSVIALPADTQLLAPQLLAGRMLQPGDTNAIVVNDHLALQAPQLTVGSEVTLQIGPSQMPWRVVGRVREPFSPATAYISRGYVEQLGGHPEIANSLRLALEKNDPAAIADARARLDASLEQEGLRALTSTTKAESRVGFDQHMVMIYVFLIVISAILAGVGGLGLMTTMNLNVLERGREMGVLRAIGATPARIWLLVVAEGCMIGAASWAIAALAAWPFSKGVGDFLLMAMFQSRLDFVFESRGLLAWLLVSVVLSGLASFLPAWHASRCSVREAIGYE